MNNKQKLKNMNHLLQNFSWGAYFETSALLLFANYCFIAWKYYRPGIDKLIARVSGRKDNDGELTSALQYQYAAEAEPIITHEPAGHYNQHLAHQVNEPEKGAITIELKN
jgi:hypothetical protein